MTTDIRDDRTVVLLHGWPGLPSDYDAVTADLTDLRTLTPDLLGMGAGFDGVPSVEASTAESHAERVLAGLDDAGITTGVIIVGYDIGSRIAQAALRADPSRFHGAVLTPAYPGIGDRAASPALALASVFWYQHFHRDPVATQLIDGDERAVRTYLTHTWNSWRADAAPPPHLDEIIAAYARPGAFAASLQWYVANRGYTADTTPHHRSDDDAVARRRPAVPDRLGRQAARPLHRRPPRRHPRMRALRPRRTARRRRPRHPLAPRLTAQVAASRAFSASTSKSAAGHCGSIRSKTSISSACTANRAYHLWFAGTTNHGARSVDVRSNTA